MGMPEQLGKLGYTGNSQGLMEFQQDSNALAKLKVVWPVPGDPIQLPETGQIDLQTAHLLSEFSSKISQHDWQFIVGRAWRQLCRPVKKPSGGGFRPSTPTPQAPARQSRFAGSRPRRGRRRRRS